jgi:hypothetical protein
MGKSKTEAGRQKVKVTYLVGDKPVHPVRIGRSMWWADDEGTIRVKTWETRKITVLGGKNG